LRGIARAVLPINVLLLIIGLTDLSTTLYWLHTGCAIEVNPIMAAVLQTSRMLFVGLKLTTLIAYVVVMEWYRRRRSAVIARLVGNFTVFAYTTIYLISFYCVNRGLFFG